MQTAKVLTANVNAGSTIPERLLIAGWPGFTRGHAYAAMKYRMGCQTPPSESMLTPCPWWWCWQARESPNNFRNCRHNRSRLICPWQVRFHVRYYYTLLYIYLYTDRMPEQWSYNHWQPNPRHGKCCMVCIPWSDTEIVATIAVRHVQMKRGFTWGKWCSLSGS